MERLIFSMVANRALDPSSKLHLEHWVANEVYIEDLPAVDSQNLYRAMDFLQEHSDVLQKAIFHTLETPQGIVRQTSEITPEMKRLFTTLQIDSPNKVLHVET